MNNAVTVLSELEAAEILQPHMRNKSALTWLRTDRIENPRPVLPFHLEEGKACYNDVDIVRFITLALNPNARFVRVEGKLLNDRRAYRQDRRKNKERRINSEIVLSTCLERRKSGRFDRRLITKIDRRNEASMLQ